MKTLDPATEAFIKENIDADLATLALKGVSPWVITQISGRRTIRRKVPSWADIEGLVFPEGVALEQCSSEATAMYKGRLAKRLLTQERAAGSSGEEPLQGMVGLGTGALLDLTGGLGVDFAWLSKAIGGEGAEGCTYAEHNSEIFRCAEVNMPLLGLGKARLVCGDGAEYISKNEGRWAIAYIDPSRRDDQGRRTYGIHDCSPDVALLMPQLMKKAEVAIIKLSPMLDHRQAVKDVEASGAARVAEVHIVAMGGECKELLLVVRPSGSFDTDFERKIYCVSDGDVRVFEDKCEARRDVQQKVNARRGDPLWSPWPPQYTTKGLFLYEPNPAIMKAGCFSQLESMTMTRQLAPMSHLFLSEELRDDFPGRGFRIERWGALGKKDVRRMLEGIDKANISVRNFPLTSEQLRTRLRLKDGGDTYVFGSTTAEGKHIIMVCRKM